MAEMTARKAVSVARSSNCDSIESVLTSGAFTSDWIVATASEWFQLGVRLASGE